MDELKTLTGPATQPRHMPKSMEEQKLFEAAQKLEASFLAQILKTSGYGKTPDLFGGKSGEDQFASFLIDAQAERMVEAGGIGLAEQLFEYLKSENE